MFEKRKLLIGLYVFVGFILVVIASFALMKHGYISKNVGGFIIIFYMVSAFIIGNLLSARYERNKTFKTYITDPLARQGFKLIEERPLTLREIFKHLDLKYNSVASSDDMSISKIGYKSKNYRMLKVQDKDNGLYWLCTEITMTSKNEYRISIIKKIDLNEKITTANIV